MFSVLKQFPPLSENLQAQSSDYFLESEESEPFSLKDFIDQPLYKLEQQKQAKRSKLQAKIHTSNKSSKTQVKNMEVQSEAESVVSDFSEKSTANTFGSSDNQIDTSQDTKLNSPTLYGESEHLDEMIQSSSSGFLKEQKPKGKKQKPQKYHLDELFPAQAVDENNNKSTTTTNKRNTVQSNYLPVKDLDGNVIYKYASSYNELVEEQLQKIHEYRVTKRSQELDQLEKGLRNLYQSHIEHQVITEKKSCVLIELHRVISGDVGKILRFCKTTILNLKKHIKPCFKQGRKCIHVQIITGQGNNQTIYNLVKSLLKKNHKQYFVKDHQNQGMVDSYFFI